jgi:hypothetical protein
MPGSSRWRRQVYFMLQKVVLVGLMGFFADSPLQLPANILITVFMLCALCRTMPSGTAEYNKACRSQPSPPTPHRSASNLRQSHPPLATR